MSVKPPAPNKILELDKENLREIDGVVLDLDSYARHISAASTRKMPQPPAQNTPMENEIAQPEPVQSSPVQDEPEVSPQNEPAQDAPAQPAARPNAVFARDPVHIGWYETTRPEEISYPIMAGANAPTAEPLAIPFMEHTGSGSYLSSYLSSFPSSFITTWITSYQYGSGSWLTSGFYGSGPAGSGALMPGGFGLELI